jgi:polo-like kinase 4
LADFGLATFLKTNDPNELRTLCGTPNYIAPEVLERKSSSIESDIWSLGCVFVTLLTGRGPFEDKTIKMTLDNIRNCRYILPDIMSESAKDLARQFLKKVSFK